MSQLTVFVGKMNRFEMTQRMFSLILNSLGVTLVDALVGAGEVEADIALTNSMSDALRMLKETEHTTIWLVRLPDSGNHAKEVYNTFASRFPERVRFFALMDCDGANPLPTFRSLIEDKTKEV